MCSVYMHVCLCVHERAYLHRMWWPEVGIGVCFLFILYLIYQEKFLLFDPEFSDLASQAR